MVLSVCCSTILLHVSGYCTDGCDDVLHRSLLESLAVHEKWSSHQICLHLMLYANEDAVDELLDVSIIFVCVSVCLCVCA